MEKLSTTPKVIIYGHEVSVFSFAAEEFIVRNYGQEKYLELCGFKKKKKKQKIHPL